MNQNFLYIALILIFTQSCKKDSFEKHIQNNDRIYFNDSVGSFTIYSVNEIIYDDFTNSSDTFNYQLMELNESVFKDNMNRDAIRIDRYRRQSDTSIWKYINTWYSVLDNTMAERIENNKRIVKLSFPVSIDAVWNLNAYNSDNAVNVFYGLINQQFNLDTFKFKNAVSVVSATINDNFKERSFREVYAKHIGLVFKNHVSIEKNGTQWRGFKINYRLLKHVP